MMRMILLTFYNVLLCCVMFNEDREKRIR